MTTMTNNKPKSEEWENLVEEIYEDCIDYTNDSFMLNQFTNEIASQIEKALAKQREGIIEMLERKSKELYMKAQELDKDEAFDLSELLYVRVNELEEVINLIKNPDVA